jgi:hypothetical protein
MTTINGMNIRHLKAQDTYYAMNFTVEAIEDALERAVLKAGIKTEMSITSAVNRTDGYADYQGVKVSIDSSFLERAMRWLVAYIRPRAVAYRDMTGGQYAVHSVDTDTVMFARYSLGE